MKNRDSNTRSARMLLGREPLGLLAVLLIAPITVLSAAPSPPGTPVLSSNNGTEVLTWLPSNNDIAVAGYNVYRDNQYITTVTNPEYTLQVDRSQDHSYYIVAFDNPTAAEPRSFSPRSAEFLLVAESNEQSNGPIPTAATDLRAERASDTSVSLSWTPATDDVSVEGYNLYRDNQYITTVSGSSVTDSGLTAGVQYQYYVVTFDEARNFSPRSTSAVAAANPGAQIDPIPVENAPVDTQAPTAISMIEAAVLSETEIDLNWEAGSDDTGVDGYNLYRDGNYLTTVRDNRYLDSDVPSANTVSYQVVAFDLARNYSQLSPARVVSPGNDAFGNPPLVDFTAEPIAGPDPQDPFGFTAELGLNSAPIIVGGPPPAPTNLRVELVSNDWAEINWAPSEDDTEVVAYHVNRSDGVVYKIAPDLTIDNAGAQAEIDKFWRTTSFIDCNFTRFSVEIFDCAAHQPRPGDVFSYTVTALDDEGNESAPSNEVTITYHLERNAPVPLYRDFYLNGDDRFASETDLSNTRFFLDKFDLVFEEDFSGSEIDSSKWNTQLTWGDNRIINGEQQYFVSTQAENNINYDPFNLTGSSLIIEAIPTPEDSIEHLPPVCSEEDPTGNDRCLFLSGALSSHDRFGLTYGYVESRMKVGGKAGMLSSFYLYHRYPGEGLFRHAPEIDIVEYLGENPFGDEDAFHTYHYDDIVDGSIRSAPTMAYKNPEGDLYADDFHTFGVLWEPQLVIWYIDGLEVKRLSGPQVGRQQMNIVLYLVAGSAWAPTPDVAADIFPLQFEVDYVRAYQRPPFTGNGVYPE